MGKDQEGGLVQILATEDAETDNPGQNPPDKTPRNKNP